MSGLCVLGVFEFQQVGVTRTATTVGKGSARLNIGITGAEEAWLSTGSLDRSTPHRPITDPREHRMGRVMESSSIAA